MSSSLIFQRTGYHLIRKQHNTPCLPPSFISLSRNSVMQVNWPRQNLGISGCSPYSIMSSKPHSNQNKHTYTHTHTPYCYHYYASLLPPSEFPCSDTGQFSEHSQVPPWSTESLRFSASLSAMGACPTPEVS